MVTKLDLLRDKAKTHNLDYDLVSRIFEVERGHLKLGKEEEKLRQEEIRTLVLNWVDKHPPEK